MREIDTPLNPLDKALQKKSPRLTRSGASLRTFPFCAARPLILRRSIVHCLPIADTLGKLIPLRFKLMLHAIVRLQQLDDVLNRPHYIPIVADIFAPVDLVPAHTFHRDPTYLVYFIARRRRASLHYHQLSGAYTSPT